MAAPPNRLVALQVLVATLGALLATPVHAQSDLRAHPRVTEAVGLMAVWLESERAYERIPGLSIGVVFDQQIIWAKGFGFADVERAVPATPTTLYSICSISKLFTATAIMQLRDAGKLGLDDPIGEHLSWFNSAGSLANADQVTVRRLLTHSSGLPRDFPFSSWTGPDYPFPSREDVMHSVAAPSLHSLPGTQWEYSNVGMTLAGEIVSAASGQTFDTYVTSRILRPLGMASTYTDQYARLRALGLAKGYTVLQRSGGRLPVPEYQVHGLAPVAGIVSTVEDMARFASWQFRALSGTVDAVLAGRTLASMHAVQFMPADAWTTAGFGYQLWKENDRSFVGHAGTCPGAQSQLLIRPQERLAIVVLINSLGASPGRYAQRAYDVFAPALRAAQGAGPMPAPSSSSATLARFTGLYQRPLGSETAVFAWQGRLALLNLPTANPLSSLELFERVSDNTFRRSGSRPEADDTVEFRMGPDGRMRLWSGSQYIVRQDP